MTPGIVAAEHYWRDGHMWDSGWSWVGGSFVMFTMVAMMTLAIWLVARAASHGANAASPSNENRARSILMDRVARGEIDEADFDARLRKLD